MTFAVLAVAGLLIAAPFVVPTEPSPPDGSGSAPSEPTAPIGSARLTGHNDPVMDLAFSPDGRTLASAGSDQTIRLWNLATRQTVRQVSATGSGFDSVAFTPDGRKIVGGDTYVVVRHVPAAGEEDISRLGEEPNFGGAQSAVAISPDGKVLAIATTDHAIGFWDIATGTRIGATMTGHTGYVRDLAFSPDGASSSVPVRTRPCGSGT